MLGSLPTKLLDCQFYPEGIETELILVEGDSASIAVGIARDVGFQAVLPMQGKPLNAWKASKKSVDRNDFFSGVIRSIGAGWDESFRLEQTRYERVVLLFDPDADGIHCGALVLMFFYRWMRPLLEAGRIYLVRPPMFEILASNLSSGFCVMTEDQALSESSRLAREGYKNVVRRRFRGLAGLGEPILSRYCLNPATRHLVRMSTQDAIAAINVFSPHVRHPKGS